MSRAFVPFVLLLLIAGAAPGDTGVGGVLTLDDALRLALERNPRIVVVREAHLAVAGRGLDAGAWPNPELSFEVENLRFSDGPDSRTTTRAPDESLLGRSESSVSNSGFGESELTLRVSQTIELGGKRTRRIALADRSTQVALWDQEVERANVIAQTRRTFIDVLAAQENMALRRRLAELARQSADTVALRVESGKDSPILRDRSEIESTQARIDGAAAERALAAARYALAAQWDDREASFESVQGDLYQLEPLPDRVAFQSALEASPDIARWSAEIDRREAALALERSNRAPDLGVNLGWRGAALPESSERSYDAGGALNSVSSTRPDGDWDHSLVFGVSVPLPLFRRNRGGVAEAEHLAAQATHERRAELAGAWARIAAAHENLQATHAEIVSLRDGILPAAERVYASVQAGFDGGKFTFLDVLDAQRTLFGVQGQFLEACAAYHRGITELERLLGASSAIDPKGNSK